jgi:hypothetical protein
MWGASVISSFWVTINTHSLLPYLLDDEGIADDYFSARDLYAGDAEAVEYFDLFERTEGCADVEECHDGIATESPPVVVLFLDFFERIAGRTMQYQFVCQ